jgi:ubiquitin carboxyl-terminal hydrolase 22/27/51
MSGAIDVAVPTAPSPAGPGEVSRGRDAGTPECSHVSAFFASREGRDTLAPLARCCVERAEVPRAAAMACLDCAALCSRAEARAHAAGAGGTDRGENLEPNPNRTSACRGVFVDVRVAELFCAPCDARAYNRDFDRAVLGARDVLRGRGNGALGKPTAADAATTAPTDDDESAKSREAKRWRGAHRASAENASSDEKEEDASLLLPLRDSELKSMRAAELARVDALGVPRGVRGVANLGNTCFMSAVLHATLRSPTVGGFFLRDGHVRELCACRAPGATSCLACELDGFASALYGGDSAPVVPAAFLRAWWHRAPEHLRGQGQHDAHEFFLGLVGAAHADLARGAARSGDAAPATDAVHAQSGNSRETLETLGAAREGARGAHDDSRCPCPMHRAFAGTLRSDVACGACGHVSTVTDPTVGLSLDVPGPGPAGADDDVLLAGSGKTRVTLEACLRRFARPERLCGAGEGGAGGGAFECARCGDRAAAKTKQMSLSRAPPTLVMHLKRFRRGAKIDRHVAFPFALDVAPYASSAAERTRLAFGDRSRRRVDGRESAKEERLNDSPVDDEKSGASDPPNPRSAYALFAVVVHSGGMESGHYICYVKCQDAWFRCDDHRVSRADPVVVAAAQAYLLFYHAV